jgi:hypothetical protein
LIRLPGERQEMISQGLQFGAIRSLGEAQLQQSDLELFQRGRSGQPLRINAEQIAQQGQAEFLALGRLAHVGFEDVPDVAADEIGDRRSWLLGEELGDLEG